MTKEEVLINKQIEYYNNHDLEGFISTYHEDAEFYKLTDNSLLFKGVEGMRKRYSERFEVQKVHAEIINRIVIGNKVIDYEHVTFAAGTGAKGDLMKAVAIYEIEDDLIRRCWFIYE